MITEEQLYASYFQKSKDYYMERLERYKNGQKYSFNIFAFLFGLFWFIYRKLYLEAFLLLILMIVSSLLEVLFTSNGGELAGASSNLILTVLFGVITGFAGNYLYLRKAERTITRTEGWNEEKAIAYVHKKGGVSYLFFIAIAIAVVLFFYYNNSGQ